MNLSKVVRAWRIIMESKKLNAAKRAVKDFLSIEMIAVKMDKDTSKKTKETAQKILGLMIASLHKRGRPSQIKDEVISNGI